MNFVSDSCKLLFQIFLYLGIFNLKLVCGCRLAPVKTDVTKEHLHFLSFSLELLLLDGSSFSNGMLVSLRTMGLQAYRFC